MIKLTLAGVLTCLILVVSILGSALPANATLLNPPRYATYPEPFQAGAYTGIYQVHWDAEPFGLLPGPCANSLITGEPVFYPAWVNFNARDFIELGIAYPCQGQRFWYGAYRDLNGFHSIFEDLINTPPLGQENIYQFFRINEIWHFQVNGVVEPSFSWNAVGNSVDAGFEVWRAEAYTQYITHHTLNKTLSEGNWVGWNGTAIADAGMCSIPITANSFKEKRPFSGTGC